MTVLMVFLGGAVGAPTRYLTDRAVQSRLAARGGGFPWGTFTVNVSGSLILGCLSAAGAVHGLPADLALLLGTGFCGGLTTFSTFSYETVKLLERGAPTSAALNALTSLAVGLAAAAAGYALVSAL
ncbi:fluoride efflux transporter CrcB [Streptacidiphilus sp. PAMC 29251]